MPHEYGLHYLDLKDKHESGVALVTTIRDNFKGYIKHEVEGAVRACCLQGMLGCQSQKDFEGIVCSNLITNCPVTQKDVSNAYVLLGQNLLGLRGKTEKHKPERMEMDYVQIP